MIYSIKEPLSKQKIDYESLIERFQRNTCGAYMLKPDQKESIENKFLENLLQSINDVKGSKEIQDVLKQNFDACNHIPQRTFKLVKNNLSLKWESENQKTPSFRNIMIIIDRISDLSIIK